MENDVNYVLLFLKILLDYALNFYFKISSFNQLTTSMYNVYMVETTEMKNNIVKRLSKLFTSIFIVSRLDLYGCLLLNISNFVKKSLPYLISLAVNYHFYKW